MITTTICFDHRGRTKKNNEGPIELRLIIDRKPYYIFTGVRVRKDEFVAGTIINRADADELNQRIVAITKKANEVIAAMIRENIPLNVKDIRQKLWEASTENTSRAFLDWVAEQIPVLKMSNGTRKHYVTLLTRLIEYDQLKSWQDLTTENIYKWDVWLHYIEKPLSDAQRKAGVVPERISDAAVHNYHKQLKALLSRAVKMGRLTANPYDRLRGEFATGDKESVEYLNEEEMKLFESIHPVPGTEFAVARDLFVLQMYTGMSFSDVQAFDIKDYRQKDGKWLKVGKRVKTKTTYVNQLLPPAVAILEKYNWKVPKIYNQHYNSALKVIASVVGIEKRLTSHVARHTFATWALHHGVPLEIVSKMLGHTNVTMTQRYAKVLAEDVADEFSRLGDLF